MGDNLFDEQQPLISVGPGKSYSRSCGGKTTIPIRKSMPSSNANRGGSNAPISSTVTARNRDQCSDGKWPRFLWLMLKILGLFWGRSVTRPRYCQHCYDRMLQETDSATHCNSRKKLIASSRRRNLSYLRTSDIGVEIDYETITRIPHITSQMTSHTSLIDGYGSVGSSDVAGHVINDTTASCDDHGYRLNDVVDWRHDHSRGGSRCRVCDSLWWDGNGDYLTYTDKSIGIKAWNHRGSRILSLLLLTLYLSLILYDAAFYAAIYWGRKNQLLLYISYMSYLIFAASVPSVSLYSLLLNAQTGPSHRFAHWPRAFDMRYIVRRLQYLNLHESGRRGGLQNRAFLALCVALPLAISLYRFLFYMLISASGPHAHSYLAVVTTLCGLSLYGHFCYLLFLMRMSFTRQLDLDISFIRRHINQLDICRGKLLTTIQDFRTLRELTSGWMVMVLGVLSWSFATQIAWNYVLLSMRPANQHTDVFDNLPSLGAQMYINGLITMENLFFLIAPLLANGGLNINYVWRRFSYRLIELRRARHEMFWFRLVQFMREQDPSCSSTRVTMIFTLIGLFVALQIGDHRLPIQLYNITDPTPPTPHSIVTTLQ